MKPDALERFRQRLLELREELLSTSDVRDQASGTVQLDDPTCLYCIVCARSS
jgi:DnaK suppressor protein